MKKILLTVVGFIGVITTQAQAPKDKSLLWEISGNGLKQPSFLYGTFHLLCPEDLKFSPAVHERLEKTKALFLELDFDDPEMMAKMQANMLMRDETSFKQLIDDTVQYAKANSAMTKLTGVSLDAVGRLKPMMLSSILYPSILGCNPSSPEEELTKLATGLKMPVNGLETIEEQLGVFDEIPYKAQAAMMLTYLLQEGRMAEETRLMLEIYRQGNIDALYEMMMDPKYGMNDYANELLNNRNKNWIRKIVKESNETPAFYAVGAGHLGGEQGVIALLRKEGFKVVPVIL
jgi:uncharacterized protein YbaP (TraB family)